MSESRKRTNEEVLAGLSCTIAEAARIMQVRDSAIKSLIEKGKLSAFESGARTKVGVPSLLRLVGAEQAPQ